VFRKIGCNFDFPTQKGKKDAFFCGFAGKAFAFVMK